MGYEYEAQNSDKSDNGGHIRATVPVTEEPIWTDPPTEPPTDPPTVPPTEPVTEATTQAPTQATTAPATAQETTEAHTESGGVIHDNTDTTEFVPPTIPKTVSEKSYTTNAAAGIISWICVIVGLIVIFAVAVSTKLSGYRAGRRVWSTAQAAASAKWSAQRRSRFRARRARS